MQGKIRRRRWDAFFRIAVVLAICGTIVFLFPKIGNFQYEYQKGLPWRYETLAAPFDFPVYKTEAQLLLDKEQLKEQQIPIFNRNQQIKDQQLKRLTEYTNKFKNESNKGIFELIIQKLDTIYNQGLFILPEDVDAQNLNILQIVTDNIGKNVDIKSVYTLKQAYAKLNRITNDQNVSKTTKESILSLNLNTFLVPNLEYDAKKTSIELIKRLQNISQTQGMVRSGEIIISKRELVTPEKVQLLNSLKEEFQHNSGSGTNTLRVVGGQVILVLIALIMFAIFLYFSRKRLFFNNKDFLFLFGMFLMTVIIGSAGYYQNLNMMALPVLFFVIIVNILFDSRPALYLLLSTTLLISYFAPNNYMFLFMQLAAGIVSIFSLSHLQRRGQLFLSILLVFITYSMVFIAFILIQEGEIRMTHLFALFWLCVNCLLLTLTYPVLYLVERLFGYTSEITLMELSNPNHPVLRTLTKKAPGTFQHSLMVANLAEEAIYRIGGSPLLVRTGALYHDIGKIYDAVFFIENQSGGANPHDECEFDESAQIIINHVTKGVEMAYKYKLPETIINFIRTHHGRSKVRYFYNSFKNKYPDQEIDEALFTYPGPDPITKECAVLMMADVIEAATRALPIKNEENISKLTHDIIDSLVAEGRFQNADITFKDISVVKRVFVEMLINIYHSRIAYPKLDKES